MAEEAARIDAGAGEAAASSSGKYWLGAALPRNYVDVSDQVDVLGLQLLNVETEEGTARTLFKEGKPKGETIIVRTGDDS